MTKDTAQCEPFAVKYVIVLRLRCTFCRPSQTGVLFSENGGDIGICGISMYSFNGVLHGNPAMGRGWRRSPAVSLGDAGFTIYALKRLR